MGRIRVGTSGWNYAGWRGDFYPDELATKDELPFAAEEFDTIEINRTFYGLITPATARRWFSAVPDDFVFAVKGSRFITHNKKLSGVGSALANFLASGVLDLGHKLGPVLWQLSENLHFDADRLDGFLSTLPKTVEAAAEMARHHDYRVQDVSYGPGRNHRIRHALEVRHPSYLCDEMASLARNHGVALAFSHASAWPYFEQVTAGFVYLRLHGPGDLYSSAYGLDRLRALADRIDSWKLGRKPDDAATFSNLAAPARKERDVYVYFDNDSGGHAHREAIQLRDLLKGTER